MTQNRLCKESFYISTKYIIISAVIGILNAITCHNQLASLVIVLIQCALLFVLLIRGDIFKYVCYYAIFISMSLEFAAFYGTENLYGFRETRVAGVGVGTLAILPIVAIAVFDFFSNERTIRLKKTSYIRFISFVSLIFVIGALIGVMNIVVNDNNVQSIENVWHSFFGELYNYVILLIFPVIAFSYTLLKYSSKIEELKSVVFSVLIGLVCTQMFSAVTPFKGSTWESKTLLVSYVSFYVPLLVCFAYYFTEQNKRISILFIGLLGTLFSTVYTLTSGGLIVVFLVPFLLLFVLIRSGRNKAFVFWVVLTVFILVIGSLFLGTLLGNASILFEYKLSQALSLIEFWKPGWYELLPRSAKFRFQETINIALEYVHKPYAFLLGKGIMGTCLDYTGDFIASNYIYEKGAFTVAEWSSGVYYSMHESFNVLFLSGGVMGISFLLWVIRTCLKNIIKSPFLLIGVIYILFHFTYSFAASNFGLLCLMLGLHEIDRIKDNNVICQ